MVDVYVKIRDTWLIDPQAAKEAIAMALEPLGQVVILDCRVKEPQQMGMWEK